MGRDRSKAGELSSGGRMRLEPITNASPIRVRMAAQIPKTKWVSAEVHIGHSAISPMPMPMPIAMGSAMTISRSMRTRARAAFIPTA